LTLSPPSLSAAAANEAIAAKKAAEAAANPLTELQRRQLEEMWAIAAKNAHRRKLGR
jgi:hypothetical protein